MLGRVLSRERIALDLSFVLSILEMLLILLCRRRDPVMFLDIPIYYLAIRSLPVNYPTLSGSYETQLPILFLKSIITFLFFEILYSVYH